MKLAVNSREAVPGTGMKADVLKVFHAILAFADFFVLAGAIIYLMHPADGMFWNAYGYIMLAVMLGNIFSAAVGGQFRYLDYIYLLLNSICMLALPVLNTVASLDIHNHTSQSLAAIILICILFLLGGASSGLRFFYEQREGKTQTQISSGKAKNIFRQMIIILMCLELLAGFYIIYDLMTRSYLGVFEVFLPEYSLFFGMMLFGAAVLIIRLRWKKKRSVFNKIIAATGLACFLACAVPLASVPFMLDDSEKSYQEAFGSGYIEDPIVSGSGLFMSAPFSMQDYFFGTPSRDYILKENVLYYEGTEGADTGKKLYFDAYMPPQNSGLPGGNSVLIRIHGGGWTIGDKGSSNYAEVNKYFASQGYVVFDIQYGLNSKDKFVEFAPVPENVSGDFTIDDMIRHIGIFTSYLADHAGEFNANLDSVFISGGSAGGQLTIATALGISSGDYSGIFDPRLNIKGYIPYYPAIGMAKIGGDPDLIYPTALVRQDSPPCLIYQGTLDGLVNPERATAFREAYLDKGNGKCALLLFPFASHGSDFYFSSYYNQIFTYYMERFMYQFR